MARSWRTLLGVRRTPDATAVSDRCRSTSARMAQPSSIWSSVDGQAPAAAGGRVPCVALISSRRSRHSATTRAPSTVSSSADHRRPGRGSRGSVGQLGSQRLEVLRGTARRSRRRARAGRPPRSSRWWPGRPGRRSGCRRRCAACMPGLSFSATSGRGDHHARRRRRRPAPWPASGCPARLPSADRRTTCPVRPMPVCTSSKISSTPCSSQSLRRPCEVARRREVDAALALDRLDQDRRPSRRRAPRRRRRGRRTGRRRSPAPSARSPAWYFGWAVAVRAAKVRPWKPSSMVTILYRPWACP